MYFFSLDLCNFMQGLMKNGDSCRNIIKVINKVKVKEYKVSSLKWGKLI